MWGGQLATARSGPGRSGGLGAPAEAFQHGLPVLSSSEPGREVLSLLPFSTVSLLLPDSTVALPEPTGREPTQLESHRPSAWICSSQCRAEVCLEWTVALETGPGGCTSAMSGVQPGSRWRRRRAHSSGPPWRARSFPCRGLMGAAALRRGSLSSGPRPLSLLPAHFSFPGIPWDVSVSPPLLCPSPCLCLSFSLHTPTLRAPQFLCFSHPIPSSSFHGLPFPVSCSQTVSDSMSALSLCFALPPPPWLPPKAPVSLPSLLGPVCPSAWAPGVRDKKSRPGADCGPCSMKESDLKPGRPGQAEAKNFSLTRRAGYLV